MKYMLLIEINPSAWERLSESEQKEVFQGWAGRSSSRRSSRRWSTPPAGHADGGGENCRTLAVNAGQG